MAADLAAGLHFLNLTMQALSGRFNLIIFMVRMKALHGHNLHVNQIHAAGGEGAMPVEPAIPLVIQHSLAGNTG
jgi:hypothetical protein